MIGGMILGNQEQTRCWGAPHAPAWLCVCTLSPRRYPPAMVKKKKVPAPTPNVKGIPRHAAAEPGSFRARGGQFSRAVETVEKPEMIVSSNSATGSPPTGSPANRTVRMPKCTVCP